MALPTKAVPPNDKELAREDVTGEEMPFGQFDRKLEVWAENPLDPIPGFHLHWINDDGDRLMRMQAQGYAFVESNEIALSTKFVPLNKDLGKYITVHVGTKVNGDPMMAYLMKIPQETYEKRKRKEQAHNDMIEDAIRRGPTADNSYVPKATPIKYDPMRPTLSKPGV